MSERDPFKHTEMRKYFSNVFADRSLREQEPLIIGAVNKLIKYIGIRGTSSEGINFIL